MQHLSSKKYEHLMHASEVFDGQNCQNPDDVSVLMGSDEVSADEMKHHLKNWSLIGAALRHELPQRIDPNFSDKLWVRIEAEDELEQAKLAERSWVPPIDAEQDDSLPSLLQKGRWQRIETRSAQGEFQDFDQAELNRDITPHRVHTNNRSAIAFKLLGSWLSQVIVAASVAVIAVLGVQFYSATVPGGDGQVANTTSTQVGPVTGLNLASYQSADNDMLITPDLLPTAQNRQSIQGQAINPDLSDAEIRAEQKAELERINLYVQGYLIDTAAN